MALKQGHAAKQNRPDDHINCLSRAVTLPLFHAAANLPDANTTNGNGIKFDRSCLQLRPDGRGPQHDARERGWFGGRLKWTKALRRIDPDAILHPSVYKRFAADRVQHFYEMKPYRPDNLATHNKLSQYYASNGDEAE